MTSLKSLITPVLSRRGLLAATAVAAMGSTKAWPRKHCRPRSTFPLCRRVKQVMVAPPFLPEHEQVAVGGPKIVEVDVRHRRKKDSDRQRGNRSLGADLQWLGAGPDDRCA